MSMIDLDQIDAPVDLEAGEWVGDIPDHPNVRLRVRSRTYKPFVTGHDRLLRSYGKRAQAAIRSDEYKEAVGKLLAEHILIDWENAVQTGGKPAKYDRKLAERVLCSIDERGMGDTFRDAVAWASGVVADRYLGYVEDVAGN